MSTLASRLELKRGSASTPGAISMLERDGIALPKFAVALLFALTGGAIAFITFGATHAGLIVAVATIAGGYMALNIGANDVANNVGPAVGSGALSIGWAIAIAAVFESAGALIAGGDVVSTISKGIINASLIPDVQTFMYAMGAALLAGALWLNLATWLGAPVSTTHSIVGGVLGGGIAAAGFSVVNWPVMSKIAASWVISPVLGGLIAATFIALIETTVFSKRDLLAASKRWVPILLGVMTSAFVMYLMMKGLKKIWKIDLWIIVSLGAVAFVVASVALRPLIHTASLKLENRRAAVNSLFNIPLIFSVALLSFAHGANDVANAVGPLSAIIGAATSAEIATKVSVPMWVMLIGAAGIALGLVLYGSKLIRTVGKQLTALDQTRAFCVCLSAAITVIAASALGLPVSSTHIAIGSVFGIGFYREFRQNARRGPRLTSGPRLHSVGDRVLADQSAGTGTGTGIYRKPRKLVRRRKLLTIAAAWFITVPAAALISACLFSLSQLID